MKRLFVERTKSWKRNLSIIRVENNRLNYWRKDYVLDECIVAKLDSELNRRITRKKGALWVAEAREARAAQGYVERLVKCDRWVIYQLRMVVKRLLKVSPFLQKKVHYVFFVGFVDFNPARKGSR